MRRKKFFVEFEVITDAEVLPDEVEAAFNKALEKPPCPYDWTIGAVCAVTHTIFPEEQEEP